MTKRTRALIIWGRRDSAGGRAWDDRVASRRRTPKQMNVDKQTLSAVEEGR
jgi:hypothetical protein